MKQRNSLSGFTLIELMIVVSLCIFITQLTTMYFGAFDAFIVHAELMNMRMFFQQMRSKAVQEGKEYTIVVDPVQQRYYTPQHEHVFARAVRFGCIDHALGPPSSPKTAIHNFVTFKENTIHFFPDGTISSGIIYITDQHKKWGYALSNGVGAVSYLRLYRYDKGVWLPL